MLKSIGSYVQGALSRSARAATLRSPTEVQRLLRFLYRLPVYYAEERSYQRASAAGLGVAVLCPADGIQIVQPSDRIAHAVFSSFFFERESSREWKAFLALAEGCRTFADIGASGGTFSVLFTSSRPESEVLSIEPDPPSLQVLADVRSLNTHSGVKRWLIDARAIGDAPGKVVFLSNGYGAEMMTDGGNEMTRSFATFNRREAKEIGIDLDTLANICRSHEFVPEIIKVDIESYEYELIVSSVAFLAEHKPRIHLELHLTALRDRGLDPRHPLRLLEEIGYSRFGEDSMPPLPEMVDAAGSVDVVRLDLLCR